MKAIEKRVAALEGDLNSGWDCHAPTHLVVCKVGQSYADALDSYSKQHPDRSISPKHNVCWIKLVAPKLDKDGKRVSEAAGPSDAPSLEALILGAEDVG